MSAPMSLQQKSRIGRNTTLAALVLLIAFMALETTLKPLALAPMLILMAVLLLPLAAFLLPVRRGNVEGTIWLALFLMPYFCWAVLGAFVPGLDGTLALLRCLLITGCFTAAMLMVRWQRAADAAANH